MGISNSRERDGDGRSLPGKIDAELGKKKKAADDERKTTERNGRWA